MPHPDQKGMKMKDGSRFRTEAASTPGAIFGAVVGVCAAVAVVMLTVKFGLVLFS